MAAVGDTGGLTWTLEPSHFPAAPTRWGAEIAVTRQTQVLTRVFAEAGLPIETLGFREFDGRVYTTIVPLGGKARKPPPKVLLPVLLKVVPELRKHASPRAAAGLLTTAPRRSSTSGSAARSASSAPKAGG